MSEKKIDDLCNEATLILSSIESMALQLGSDSFGAWSDSVRDSYGEGIRRLARDATELIVELHERTTA